MTRFPQQALSRMSLLASQLSRPIPQVPQIQPQQTMSTQSNQPAHPLSMIPGPIEMDDKVLQAMTHPAEPHTAGPFCQTFSKVLKMMRQLFLSTDPNAQPFVISGSGTLGWDIVATNLVEQGENALVLNTGYFSASFADCLSTYGANVDQLTAQVGDRPSLEQIEQALKSKTYKVITITHVDTSTGVLSDIKAISELVQRVSPNTLVIVDGVCSVGSEPIRFDDWKIDFVLTAPQKGIGAPAGLSLSYASARAMETVANRKTPIQSYFASLARWAPIMKNYEAGKPSYFATPPVQNVYALAEALSQLAVSTEAVEKTFEAQAKVSDKVKDYVESSLGLKTVAVSRGKASHALTCIYLPEGIANTDLVPTMLKKGVAIAGGIHKEIATKYFRIGHMGVSALRPELGHVDTALQALTESLAELGYKK